MRKNERIRLMNEYCHFALAELYSSDKMQAVICYNEVQIIYRARINNMNNVILTDCLDLRCITFKTKKAKNDFFKAFFQAVGWW